MPCSVVHALVMLVASNYYRSLGLRSGFSIDRVPQQPQARCRTRSELRLTLL
jgi:hypothetical protein